MTDFQLLCLVLALIYVSDCVFWVRRGSIVLRGWLTNRCGVAHPSPGFGSANAGIVPLNPLPPFGNAYVCNPWPLSLTADTAYSFVPTVPNRYERPEQLARLASFDAINSVTRDGTLLLVDGQPFIKLACEASALHVARLLLRLAGLPREKRPGAIDAALRRSMNLDAVRRRLKRFQTLASPMRLQAHLIALVLFVAVPLTIADPNYRRFLPASLVLLLGLLLINALNFALAHRRLFPAAAAARYRSVLAMIFSPPGAIRVRDILSRDLFAAFDPLAAALVLCDEKERLLLARAIVRDLAFPMQPASPSDGRAEQKAILEFHERYRGAIHLLLKRAGIDPAALLDALEPSDPSCHSYCPRCEAQFVLAAGECANCGGIALRPFAC